ISDKDFLQKLGSDYTSIESFLEKLKNGPCKNNNGENEKKEDGYIDFNKEDKTFGHENYCDPCFQFKIDCQKANCTRAGTNDMCNGTTVITVDNFNNKTDPNGNIEMLVSDDSTTEFEGEGLKEACKNAHIFEGIRKEEWKCRNECGYVVCKQEKGNGKQNENKQIIQINALLQRWVHNFLDDYKKIRKKLKTCIKNRKGKDDKCIIGCKENCECVKKWLELKSIEWKNIKERFNEQYKKEKDEDFNLRSFLETLIPENHLVNGEKKLIKLSVFDKSCGCSADASSTNGNEDAIDCMIKKLEDKITSCKMKHTPSGETQRTCDESSTPLVEDDEEDLLLEEDEQNQVKPPEICKDVIKAQTETVVEEKCDAPPAQTD
ncbi:hypothetical protein PFTANZ_06053, partial [Plasmodium falciparum Tanzania (2000708)]